MELTELIVPDNYNTRGIPRAVFFENVATFVANCGDVSHSILDLENKLAQYNLMFQSLDNQRNTLRNSLPSLHNTLESLEFVQEKGEDVIFYHQLVDGIYVKARINNNKKVGIFLGSNVMVDYTVEEAKNLIQENIRNVEKQIKDCELNLEFLKEQITIIEVSVSRVFNYDVQQRKLNQTKEK
ncbi:Prefoldin_subunit 3 [Hexamita inflata]|uniref:Prefoldin subunit 3 n=1 Tax=Hexamita inflata TaxID=28002 RepID=A0AA86UWS3_9EUKA|nr:Prefoldin subunit 3 [Hexamita inflata]CAI9975055.1 Prefoldin subunit 3 [Hexamita inflata]